MDSKSRVRQQIQSGLESLQLGAEPALVAALAGYLELLIKWNQAYNLTAVRAPEEMVSRHLMDSLAVLPFVEVPRLIDVGTGAGLPGLVLAIARPSGRFVLLDSGGKKTRFVEHAASRLGLANVEVVKARAEEHRDEMGFDVVLSRAFSSTADFIRLAGHLAKPDGRLLAMKGALREAELAALPAGWQLAAVHELSVPGLSADRHLQELRRARKEP